jgi:hypothetical protein
MTDLINNLAQIDDTENNSSNEIVTPESETPEAYNTVVEYLA